MTISLDIDGPVARLELNRPESSNAVDLPTAELWLEKVGQISRTTGVGAVLVTGAGKRFCAGGDVSAMAAVPDRPRYVHQLASVFDQGLRALAELPLPVVAAVQGAVAGAGLGLMLSCDLVVAERPAKFTAGYPGVGLTPDCGVSWLLPRAIGQQRALDFLLTGKVITADEALAIGLVGEVVEEGSAAGRAAELAARMAEIPALGRTRQLVRGAWAMRRDEAGELEAETISELSTSVDAEMRLRRFTSR